MKNEEDKELIMTMVKVVIILLKIAMVLSQLD
ncbi:hypothetical protein FLCU109888_12290 [Flavobacterium cucumis]|uniref:Uncharacterized protein n=1 Tax=Flavobacterium cucumis TaxID=416016 RepID=A0A1M7ZYW1_9FLAO|nr:hypothetical protein SAMN05443547_2436 [Flavobacterium cucumis]